MNQLVKIQPSELVVQTADHVERQEIVAVNMLNAIDHVQKDMISLFSSYVDQTGDKASSPGGLKTQINIKIKAAYGRNRDSMTGAMRLHCSTCFTLISKIIDDGMNSKKTRRQIKDDIWNLIKMFGKHYQELKGFFDES